MIELEKTYLVKKLPCGLKDCKFKEIIDIYIPQSSEHPTLRIRKNGAPNPAERDGQATYEATKKEPVNEGDSSHQEEQTIILTEAEFNALSKLDGKKVRKLRYYYDHNGNTAEVGVFQDLLKGLIMVDFEFSTIEEKDAFEMPDFCLAEVTQECFTAGGMICGKSYKDIENDLNRYNYKNLFLE